MRFQLIRFILASDIQERLSELLAYMYEYENEIKGTLQRCGIDILSVFQETENLFVGIKVRDAKRALEMLENETGSIEDHIRKELAEITTSFYIMDNLFNLESAASCPF